MLGDEATSTGLLLLIVGFNVGVELGQLAVAATILAGARLVAWLPSPLRTLRWQHATLTVAATIASYWLVVRIVGAY